MLRLNTLKTCLVFFGCVAAAFFALGADKQPISGFDECS